MPICQRLRRSDSTFCTRAKRTFKVFLHVLFRINFAELIQMKSISVEKRRKLEKLRKFASFASRRAYLPVEGPARQDCVEGKRNGSSDIRQSAGENIQRRLCSGELGGGSEQQRPRGQNQKAEPHHFGADLPRSGLLIAR